MGHPAVIRLTLAVVLAGAALMGCTGGSAADAQYQDKAPGVSATDNPPAVTPPPNKKIPGAAGGQTMSPGTGTQPMTQGGQ